MSYLQAVVLALVQGVTEFLPISSSAHLVLVPYLFGWPDQGLAFDVATNTGTLVAVVLYFRRELAELIGAGLRSLMPGAGRAEADGARLPQDARLAWAVVLGTIPVGIAGLLLHDWVETAGRNPWIIAATSIGFGLLLWWADRVGSRRRELGSLGFGDAAVVGLAQAIALVPGTSRSGITITAGLFRGFTREEAARFSFLLYVPVGVLAAGKEAWDFFREGGAVTSTGLGPVLVGFALSAIAAYFAIGALLAWVRRASLTVFVVYRIVLGLVILAVLLTV
jgi:undecaprenyl-diphosphatase